MPWIAVDAASDAFRDRMYVAWTDVTAGCVQVMFSYSADKGKTWARPRIINDDQAFDATDPSKGPDDFMPAIAVNRAGVVAVSWYDRRENSDNLGWRLRLRASLDGGETFLLSVPVSDATSRFGQDEQWPIFYWRSVAGGGTPAGSGGPLTLSLKIQGQHFNGGDYAGLATDADGIFHPFWVDNRTGTPQVWTAEFRVEGHTRLNGTPELSSFADVISKVTVQLENVRYDRRNNRLVLDARLVNTSQDSISAPIKVRVTSMTSEIAGHVEFLSDNGDGSAEGAVSDFTGLLRGDTLRPNQKTEAKHLTLALSDLQPLWRARDVKLGLIDLEVKVLSSRGSGVTRPGDTP